MRVTEICTNVSALSCFSATQIIENIALHNGLLEYKAVAEEVVAN